MYAPLGLCNGGDAVPYVPARSSPKGDDDGGVSEVFSRTIRIVASCFPLHPLESHFLKVWSSVTWLVLLTVAFFVPFEVAFSNAPDPPNACWANRFLNFFTLCDIVIGSVTAAERPGRPGVFETRLLVSTYGYLQSGFIVDAASLTPFLLQAVVGDRTAHKFRLLRLARLLRLFHFLRITQEWQAIAGVHTALITLVNRLGFILFMLHAMACVWVGVALEVQAMEAFPVTWLDALQASKGGPGLDYQFHRTSGLYAMSLYWASMTLTGIGYGDIVAENELEYWVAMVCMLGSGMMWATTIAEVCGVVTNLFPHDIAIKQQIDELNWLMEERQVCLEKRRELRRYVFQSRRTRRLLEQRRIVESLSPMLQAEVIGSMMDPFRSRVAFFRDLRADTLVALSRSLDARLYAPKETLRPDRSICLVCRGMALRGGKVLTVGNIWGEDAILHNSDLRDMSAVCCISYFEVLALPVDKVFEAVRPFPAEQAKLRWAKIRLALWRGIRLILFSTKLLREKSRVELRDLAESDMLRLYSDTLLGRFTDPKAWLNARRSADRRGAPSPAVPAGSGLGGGGGAVAGGPPMARPGGGCGAVDGPPVAMPGRSADIVEMRACVDYLMRQVDVLSQRSAAMPPQS